jgi:hypothetical protein
MNANQKTIWIAIASFGLGAIGIGIWYPVSYHLNPVNQPNIEKQTSRASGFTMKAEAIVQKNSKTNKSEIRARLFATGPMHNNEVIRMEGQFSLITPTGQTISFGPMNWTFSENLKAILPVDKVAPGSKVKVTGIVYVYHREEIKSEREMTSDGSVRLYMNTGTVTFRKVPNSKPPQIEMECLDLNSVHFHGLELMSQDKKTVANRLLLSAGKQLVDRETLPYLGRQIGMEPYIIRQLIPKRQEPMTLVITVQNTGP